MINESGDLTIMCAPRIKVNGSYTISKDDGRLCVCSWKKFMDKQPTFRMGDKILFLLLCTRYEVKLFVTHFPDVVQ
jgi:hypothetical protein